jgi:16S rRNA (guanine(966)-N(2))-methyltransferase RsmD
VVREALFNVLAARLDFDRLAVLDLYAGSGALGLEALSRGAVRATFVESDPRAAAVIRQNVEALGLSGATVLARGVDAVLQSVAADPFDLVLADPPYDLDTADVEQMLVALARRGWTRPGTVVAVERRSSGGALSWPDGWTPWRTRRYGDTWLQIADAT